MPRILAASENARLEEQVHEFLTRHPEALKTSKPPSPKRSRNRKVEDHLSKTLQAAALARVRIDRDANGGEEEIFQVAQALILCGLPYDKTDQTKITRSARLADGSVVDLTFSTPGEQQYLRALADLGPGVHRSGEVARSMGMSTNKLGPRRDALIKKGMIYSPNFGEVVFTVPLFDAFMKRAMPHRE